MPAPSRQKPDVSHPCLEYSAMLPVWTMLGDVFAGSETIRQGCAVYLPRHEQEPIAAYQERVNLALTYDFLPQTIAELSGRAFSKAPVWSELADGSKWKGFLADVDAANRDANNFSRSFFSNGLLFGRIWAYVEITGDRPTWTLLDPRDVFFIATDKKGQITEARFRREVVKVDGFEEIVSEEIVRITLDRVETWTKPGKKWERTSNVKNAAGVVPLISFAPEPDGAVCAKAPLLDLAELTLTHARRLSDLETALRVSSFPMLSIQTTDGGESSSFQVGPHTLISLDPECEARYVEHSGAAISVLQTSLRDLEERAASFGVRLLKRRRPSVETATAASIAGQEASAPLQGHVIAFGDALRALVALTAKLWPAGGEAPTVALSIDFLPSEGTSADLISLRQTGDISRFDLLEQLKARGVLSSRFDVTLNEARLSDEAPILSSMRGGHDHAHA